MLAVILGVTLGVILGVIVWDPAVGPCCGTLLNEDRIEEEQFDGRQ